MKQVIPTVSDSKSYVHRSKPYSMKKCKRQNKLGCVNGFIICGAVCIYQGGLLIATCLSGNYFDFL